MTRPMELAVRLGWYVMKNKAARHKKFSPGDHARAA